MKKRGRPLYENSDEISHICATCMHALPLDREDEYLCSRKGVVARGFSCRNYKINLLLKRPPKKHTLNTSRYKPEDFSID